MHPRLPVGPGWKDAPSPSPSASNSSGPISLLADVALHGGMSRPRSGHDSRGGGADDHRSHPRMPPPPQIGPPPLSQPVFSRPLTPLSESQEGHAGHYRPFSAADGERYTHAPMSSQLPPPPSSPSSARITQSTSLRFSPRPHPPHHFEQGKHHTHQRPGTPSAPSASQGTLHVASPSVGSASVQSQSPSIPTSSVPSLSNPPQMMRQQDLVREQSRQQQRQYFSPDSHFSQPAYHIHRPIGQAQDDRWQPSRPHPYHRYHSYGPPPSGSGVPHPSSGASGSGTSRNGGRETSLPPTSLHSPLLDHWQRQDIAGPSRSVGQGAPRKFYGAPPHSLPQWRGDSQHQPDPLTSGVDEGRAAPEGPFIDRQFDFVNYGPGDPRQHRPNFASPRPPTPSAPRSSPLKQDTRMHEETRSHDTASELQPSRPQQRQNTKQRAPEPPRAIEKLPKTTAQKTTMVSTSRTAETDVKVENSDSELSALDDDEDSDGDDSDDDDADEYIPGANTPKKQKISHSSSSPARGARSSARLRDRRRPRQSSDELLEIDHDAQAETSAAAALRAMATAALQPRHDGDLDVDLPAGLADRPKKRTYVRRDAQRRKEQNAQAQKKFRLKKKKIAEDMRQELDEAKGQIQTFTEELASTRTELQNQEAINSSLRRQIDKMTRQISSCERCSNQWQNLHPAEPSGHTHASLDELSPRYYVPHSSERTISGTAVSNTTVRSQEDRPGGSAQPEGFDEKEPEDSVMRELEQGDEGPEDTLPEVFTKAQTLSNQRLQERAENDSEEPKPMREVDEEVDELAEVDEDNQSGMDNDQNATPQTNTHTQASDNQRRDPEDDEMSEG